TFVDAHGTRQHVMVVIEKRNMFRTMPTVTKLYKRSEKLQGKAGQTVLIRLEMERTSNMLNAMQMTVQSKHPEIRNLLKDLQFAKGQTSLELSVQIPQNLKPGRYPFTLQATGPLDSKPDHTVVTATDLELVVLSEE
ncbi:MAG: hypothetical protein VX776_03625, partial [Planctomycetota bacterium]|nr:hypothetical protein [Planctomycetota bacterium]